MRSSNQLRTLVLLSQALVVMSACTAEIEGQSRSQPSARDTARQIQRVERDQQLLLKPLPPTKEENAARIAALKQSKEDFRTIQNINNKMMADAWAKDELDYGSISDSLSQIKSKAVRLRSNLALPTPEKEKEKEVEKKPINLSDGTVKTFRSALLVLDRSIMKFVTNPTFKESTVVEVSQATNASHELETIIGLSDDLQKAAKSLSKKSAH